MILEIVLVSSLTVTAYRAIPEQTDNSPTITSIGHPVHPYGAAASQDLIRSGEICYGDMVAVDGQTLRVINDTMNPRIKRGLDLFVETRAEESKIGVRRNQTVQLVRSPRRSCRRREAESMSMINAKKIKNALANFRRDKGREPTIEEFRVITSGATVTRAHNDLKGQRGDGGAGAGQPGH